MAEAKEQKNSTMSDREFYFLMGVVALILLILYLTKHEESILFSIYRKSSTCHADLGNIFCFLFQILIWRKDRPLFMNCVNDVPEVVPRIHFINLAGFN